MYLAKADVCEVLTQYDVFTGEGSPSKPSTEHLRPSQEEQGQFSLSSADDWLHHDWLIDVQMTSFARVQTVKPVRGKQCADVRGRRM